MNLKQKGIVLLAMGIICLCTGIYFNDTIMLIGGIIGIGGLTVGLSIQFKRRLIPRSKRLNYKNYN